MRGAALALALLAAPLAAQAPQALVQRGDSAAHGSRHRDAIAAYEQAIAADPALRVALLPRLGRQYLWMDRPGQAADLFSQYLSQHPDACETQLDLALAYSWSGKGGQAESAYRRAAELCPDRRAAAQLGMARVMRWSNRPAAAAAAYREVLGSGSVDDRAQAEIGLAYVALADGRPRQALARLDRLADAGVRDGAIHEGRVQAYADLGLRDRALAAADQARQTGFGSPGLDRLVAAVRRAGHANFAPRANGFEDRDGTRYRAGELPIAVPFGGSFEANLLFRASHLISEANEIDSREAQAALGGRIGPGVGIRVAGGLRQYDAVDFDPWEGEVNLAVTPSDMVRMDFAAARILVGDNAAALREHLTGDFVSAGMDARLGGGFAVAVSGDATRWSEDNTRYRARLSMRHRFAGTPLVTVEWPTVYQRYDEPFDFVFFSPRSYVETGPGISVWTRLDRYWSLSVYGRGGAQHETDGEWKSMGTGRLSIERELTHWGIGADVSWSNSNLSGSTGFQRTAVSLRITARP